MENIVEEIWKDIPGYENMYQVSNLGNVKSLPKENRNGRCTYITKEKILKPGVNKSGYCRVILVKNSIHKTYTLHQLVAMAFLNHVPCKYKLVVDHINNIKTDNRVENLQVVSQRENSSKDRKSSSIYTGVCWCKKKRKWKSNIRINGVLNNLGYFVNEYEAHLKYQETLKNLKSC